MPPQGEGGYRQRGHQHLDRLDHHYDARFAQPVRQAAGRGREQQKRQYEGRPDGGGDHAGLVGPLDADQAEDDQQLEDVVVHRPQKLGRVEASEGAGEFGGCVFQCWPR